MSRPKRKSISLTRTFASLRHRNFRLWFFGQMISLFGTWMQTTALGFYAYAITGSKGFLGLITLAAGLPTLVLLFVGGVTADHLPRRTLLVITQTALMLLAFLLAVLTFLHAADRCLLLVIAALTGVVNSFDAPARQSFLLEMVDRKTLTNAIALNSTMFNIALAVGPAAGGGAYALLGPAGCFFVNGLSFAAVIIALLLMKLPAPAPISSFLPASPFQNIISGLRYILSEPRIGAVILAAMAASFFGFSLYALFPAWAVEVLHGDETTNGFLQSSRGFGSMLAAFFIASRGDIRNRRRWMSAGLFLFPAAFIVFSFLRPPLLSLAVVFVIGAGMMLFFNLANAVIQLQVKDEFRGRVMSLYSLTFFAIAPVGSLFFGALADMHAIGVQGTVRIASVILFAVACAALFFTRKVGAARGKKTAVEAGRR